MEKTAFGRLLKRLLDYYQRPDPSDATVNLWHEAVASIPDEAADAIYSALTARDSFPRNLPAAMWAAYNDWRSTRPPSPAEHHDPDHAGCWQGRWLVARWIPDLAEWAIYDLPCGGCHPGTGPATRDAVLAKLPDGPDRYSGTIPPKALVYPDADSIGQIKRRIISALAQRRPRPHAVLTAADELPF